MTVADSDLTGLRNLPEGRTTDVLCLGHAIVDRLAHVPPEAVADRGLEVGSMTLVDGDRAVSVATLADEWQQVSGGSAANTAAGVASLGGRPAFVGSVGPDELA